MSFASDKLFNGYLRRNRSAIASKVKVREIINHLPCLTAHDRENIEAKREQNGNYDAMDLLLDCLRRREHWPEQFMEALEACEQSTLAAEIQAEYNALIGSNNAHPSPPPVTQVRVHVHPPPAANHPPSPGTGGNIHGAVALSTETPPATPEMPAQFPSPPECHDPQVAFENPVPSPAPPSELPQSAKDEVPPPPSTPPPSPETPRSQDAPEPLPHEVVLAQLEPEENTESVIQDVPRNTNLFLDKETSGNIVAAASSDTTPPQQNQAPDCGTKTSSHANPPQTTVLTNGGSPDVPSEVVDGSSVLTLTPEKQPVQDTTPPVNKVTTPTLLHPDTTESAPEQIVVKTPQTEPAATAFTGPPAEEKNILTEDSENTICMSKPGQLVSIQPVTPATQPVQASSPPEGPYSGSSERLQFSTSDDLQSVCAAVSTSGVHEDPPPCLENGIALNHNTPEENHYESPGQSLEVKENVVHVSEMPSMPNLDGSPAEAQLQINGDAAKESLHDADVTASGSNSPRSEIYNPPPPAQGIDVSPDLELLHNSKNTEDPKTQHALSNNTKYLLTAAGVGALALVVAWKFKH